MPKKLSRAELFAQLKDHFSEIGKKGGSAKTAKKQKASRKNAIKYKTEAERKEARLRTIREYQKKRRINAKLYALETELTSVKNGQSAQAEHMTLAQWIEEANIPKHPYQNAMLEYLKLKEELTAVANSKDV